VQPERESADTGRAEYIADPNVSRSLQMPTQRDRVETCNRWHNGESAGKMRPAPLAP